ncbi:MAG: hypothetical protein JNL18_24080 [Planctomycetaceae bacterium]|nr:hypothetical protein [Planctomycetaceae bacterium]
MANQRQVDPAFRAVLHELGFSSYRQYRDSPRWASIRQRVYEKKGRVCVECRLNPAVEIHHRQYDRETMVGETLRHLDPVCRHCHDILHGDVLWATAR